MVYYQSGRNRIRGQGVRMVTGQGNPSGPRTIKASEFKAKCLKLMDEVAENGEEIVITKNGKPVAKLTAYRSGRPVSLAPIKNATRF